MNKIFVNFENCYGIKKIGSFDFSSKRIFAIYSPNGVMKTSFAKTFKDISNDAESQDLIFQTRKTKRSVVDKNGSHIKSENIFVIEPYNETFKSEKVSTLLVNAKLKKQYEKIHSEIDNKKEALLDELKPLSEIKSNIEETISEVFTRIPNGFFTAITRIENEVLDSSLSALENKIVLAISIRLIAELFVVKKINDDDDEYWKGITKNQSFALYSKYKEIFPDDVHQIKLLEQVNLMTPENIHVNSFMYEPILDMSNVHLKNLYSQVKIL